MSRNHEAFGRLFAVACAAVLSGFPLRGEAVDSFLSVVVNTSTVPANGDMNPYGVAFVPKGFPSDGAVQPGDVLVSNFNDSVNIQGTGTTIVQFSPGGTLAPPGSATTFFSSPQLGLSTALGVLRGGFVLVGNVPTSDGTFNTIGQSALQIIDRHGSLMQTWTDPQFLDGPWDLAIDDEGGTAHIFVSNVLNGTVTRLDVDVGTSSLTLLNKVTIAAGYQHVPNAAAVVLGPTGLAYDKATDTLYVAATADNAIYAVGGATQSGGGTTPGPIVFADPHLRGPLALKLAPNGNLLTANGDAVNPDPSYPSEIVEFTKNGQFVRQYNVDSSPGGAFGMDTVRREDADFNFAVVDDVTNNLAVMRQVR